MDRKGAESRRSRRVYFPEELVIMGIIADVDLHAQFQVKVLNLSVGGLFFTLSRKSGRCFLEHERILFMGLREAGASSLSQTVPMEIKWVCDNPILDNIGYGCEFIDPPSGFVDQIRELVARFP